MRRAFTFIHWHTNWFLSLCLCDISIHTYKIMHVQCWNPFSCSSNKITLIDTRSTLPADAKPVFSSLCSQTCYFAYWILRWQKIIKLAWNVNWFDRNCFSADWMSRCVIENPIDVRHDAQTRDWQKSLACDESSLTTETYGQQSHIN